MGRSGLLALLFRELGIYLFNQQITFEEISCFFLKVLLMDYSSINIDLRMEGRSLDEVKISKRQFVTIAP